MNQKLIEQARRVKLRTINYFNNCDGTLDIPEGMKFLKDYIEEVEKLCVMIDGEQKCNCGLNSLPYDAFFTIKKCKRCSNIIN